MSLESADARSRRATLPYGRQLVDEEDIAAVVDVLRGDWLTQGPMIEEFESAICAATGATYAIAVSSGTAALHIACIAAGVTPGDTGTTSAITFVASANCIRYAGGRPEFCDVDPETGLLSVAALHEQVRAGAPKVIIPVDLAGTPCDLPAIQHVARECGAVVIEDAAHAVGATYTAGGAEHRAAGCAHSDMAILSFHPVKHITTGEGGAVTTNDPELAATLRDLRSHGITRDPDRLVRDEGPWYYEQHRLGFNYRITDIQCALGVNQMRKLERYVARRRELAARYDRAFAEPAVVDHLRPLTIPAGRRSSYHLYVIRLLRHDGDSDTDVLQRRRALYDALRSDGILTQIHYVPVPRQPDFERNGLGRGDFPGADAYYAGCLSLPLFPGLANEDVDRVVAIVRQALGAAA
ncbi:MAG TPA: UDP-4-amino-4,6-dideoxy-N-acetyl-beta-L-altrosamine transaminase [Solirubrobacteraceae bacterium]|nr:UDP-4-amino-4,6-dideoxy-N-acetyl-beta-L-altrosamine transaminase [Solirubrobacteraceae bacterium]